VDANRNSRVRPWRNDGFNPDQTLAKVQPIITIRILRRKSVWLTAPTATIGSTVARFKKMTKLANWNACLTAIRCLRTKSRPAIEGRGEPRCVRKSAGSFGFLGRHGAIANAGPMLAEGDLCVHGDCRTDSATAFRPSSQRLKLLRSERNRAARCEGKHIYYHLPIAMCGNDFQRDGACGE